MTLKRGLLTTLVILALLVTVALVDYLIQLGRSEGAVAPGTEAGIGGEFSLVDQSTTPVTNTDFSDRYKLIFFGFTHCPDVCPTTLSRMSQTLKQLGPLADQLYPLFITVDPERDTPERLSQYAKAFDPRIIYLTGSPEEIAQVLKAWQATRAKIAAQTAGSNDYTMSHSSVLYLMTPDDRLAASYNWEIEPEAMERSISSWLKR
ncbi:MAG: SCO family protein [Gammaproteobacteria bacterium]|nr:MAG: SCO family protein [Gammaproteobacteria bacterium]RLA51854.1 MAG: SCO family protein [Gammaproteobacteria bacterium]